jgi:hypothetical protein
MPKISEIIGASLAQQGETALLIAEGRKLQADHIASLARKLWAFIRSL